jgi:hypothetical protein
VRNKLDTYNSALLFSLLFAVFLLIALYNSKNFYNVSLINYVISISSIVIFSQAKSYQKIKKSLILVMLIFILVGNSRLIYASYVDWSASWKQNRVSIAKQQADLRDLVSLCRADLSKPIIMDKLAYQTLRETPSPVLADYVYGWWGTGIDVLKVKKDLAIGTFIGPCSYLNEKEKSSSVQHLGYCCLKY